MSPTTVSVLICTYNRDRLLDKCLAALIERGTRKPDQIVVVNGGDERASAVIRRRAGAAEVPIEAVCTRNVNLATSRNIGLSRCTGDIVAMTDDDAEVFPDWIEQIARLHGENPNAGA